MRARPRRPPHRCTCSVLSGGAGTAGRAREHPVPVGEVVPDRRDERGQHLAADPPHGGGRHGLHDQGGGDRVDRGERRVAEQRPAVRHRGAEGEPLHRVGVGEAQHERRAAREPHRQVQHLVQQRRQPEVDEERAAAHREVAERRVRGEGPQATDLPGRAGGVACVVRLPVRRGAGRRRAGLVVAHAVLGSCGRPRMLPGCRLCAGVRRRRVRHVRPTRRRTSGASSVRQGRKMVPWSAKPSIRGTTTVSWMRTTVACTVSVLLALGTTTAAAAADDGVRAQAPAASGAGASDVQVTELDLDGVSDAVLAELPTTDQVPMAESDEAGSAAPDAAAPDAASPDAAAPDATAPEASPQPGASPAPSPSATAGAEAPDAAAREAAPADEVRPDPDVLTTELDTDAFSVVGVTWDRTPGLEDVVVRYRVKIDGAWTDWQGVESSDVAPDTDSQDDDGTGARDGTDPIVAVGADGVQIWAEAGAGEVTGLKAVLVDPGADPTDVGATVRTASASGTAAASDDAAASGTIRTAASVQAAVAAPAAPAIISRAGWGADESLRTCSPDYSNSLVSAAVHHTASANGYSADAVPGLLRGFYAYHTRPEAAGGRGWCDIGYNFLVDQFGRVFEGRAGGIESTVIGVHTGGFNSRTIGIAAIGEYGSVAPSAALLESLSRLIAWKFSVHGISASGVATMTSGGGASKYPAGTVVTFPTIYAHRDAQLTSCPGQGLYDALPAIRARVAQLSDASVAASPRGRVEAYAGSSAGVRVTGWASDPETTAPLTIAVSVDGAVQTIVADRNRPDVGRHGFDATVGAAHGSHVVCVTAVNVGGGRSTVLGCQWVTVTNPIPIGALESVSTTASAITVSGWALDPDTTEPIAVHVYVDGVGRAVTADLPRPDVGAAFGKGSAHGFAVTIPATGGSHSVCVYAINTPAGANATLGCRTVAVGAPPVGSLEAVTATASSVTVSGWALDPDTSDSIQVHVYVDGTGTAVRADRNRPDVAGFGRGTAHGYSVTLPAAAGTRTVCAYAMNVPSGPATALGCRTVTVTNAVPVGSLEAVTRTASAVTVTGWALDADTRDPIAVHVYVGDRGTAAVADRQRPDVAGFGLGTAHGFQVTVPATGASGPVCVYAINTPGGPPTSLGCR